LAWRTQQSQNLSRVFLGAIAKPHGAVGLKVFIGWFMPLVFSWRFSVAYILCWWQDSLFSGRKSKLLADYNLGLV
jgi:hypothetical protein